MWPTLITYMKSSVDAIKLLSPMVIGLLSVLKGNKIPTFPWKIPKPCTQYFHSEVFKHEHITHESVFPRLDFRLRSRIDLNPTDHLQVYLSESSKVSNEP